jgi:hypothetical protein
MRVPDGAHTHGGGGGGLGTAVLVLVGAALAVKLAAPVATAVVSLVSIVLWAVGIVAAAVLVGGGAYAVYRLRYPRREAPLRAQATVIRPQPRQLRHEPPAIGQPQEIHLHLHDVTAEDVAAIIEHHRQDGPG